MSKERLEEIAYNVGVSIDGEKALMSSDDYDFLYNYAKEQAERVQELENHLKLYEFWYRTAYEQNKRYREAIEYIKLELRDFRKDANMIQKLSRDKIVKSEAFRLSCNIRDCLKALEGEE